MSDNKNDLLLFLFHQRRRRISPIMLTLNRQDAGADSVQTIFLQSVALDSAYPFQLILVRNARDAQGDLSREINMRR